MLIIIIGILIPLTIWSIHKFNNCSSYDDEIWAILLILFGSGAVIASFAFLILLGVVTNGFVIDDEIAILEQRNTEINNSLAETISNYTQYESNTYERLKMTDAVVVMQAFPDLKMQPLVEQQINTYINNQNEITKKQQEKARLKVARWWLILNLGESK